MLNLTYQWEGPGSLASEVTKPFEQISIAFVKPLSYPMYATLRRSDGSCIKIYSQVEDVAERMEMGKLYFKHLNSPSGDDEVFPLAPEFNQYVEAFKLVVHEPEARAESGILFRASNGAEIVIAAGVMAFTLAIKGVVERPRIFEPEYGMKRFERIQIESKES